MKKWYFSDNGNVSGPFSVNEAHSILSKKSEIYGWNPSFSQWLPVTEIPELAEFISDSQPAAQVSKELIDKFVNKKRDLKKKVSLIDESISKTQKYVEQFEAQIAKYKSLTQDLSEDVQDNIVPIEKKQRLVARQLADLTNAADIAKQEIVDVVEEFGDLVLSKKPGDSDSHGSVKVKTTPKPQFKANVKEISQKQVTKPRTPAPDITYDKPKKEQVSFHKTVEKPRVKTKTIETVEAPTVHKKTSLDKISSLKEKKITNHSHEHNEVSVASSAATISGAQALNEDKGGFSEVKSKLRSVFKPKVEEPAPMSFSEKMRQLDNEPDDEVMFIDSDDIDDESEERKKRRRRRRF